eukprot:scaffold45935_cov75-Phaeocystis_antarctica.AAC.1
MWGERYQPECRLFAGRLLAPLRPARHDRVLGARRLLLITPGVAQKGGHLPHRRRLRALVERPSSLSRILDAVGKVRCEQPAGGQAPEELRGAVERGVGSAAAAADERRDRRGLFLLIAAPAQAPQAAVDAATIAGRGEGGAQEEGNTHSRSCPSEVVVSLDVVCDAECSAEHAVTQEEKAGNLPQPPQGGAGLHGALAAAAQRGGERGDGGELQRSNREAKSIWQVSRECCVDGELAHTTRIARASVGKRARRRRQAPGGSGIDHHRLLPTAASIDWPAKYMIVGVAQITNSAHPACPMAKLTRSRRPAADSRAARNTPLNAAELAAPEVMLRAATVTDREVKVAAPWAPALDAASAPRCSRRQPARPRSRRVGSTMAMAAAKAIACLQIAGKGGRDVAAGAHAGEIDQTPRKRDEAHTAVARQSTPLPSPGERALLLVKSWQSVRLALPVTGP